MALKINTKYPSIDDLRAKARKKIPKFAFEYLDGGCNEDVNLHRNTSKLRAVQLKPNYLRDHAGSSQKTTLFGVEYDAPFGFRPRYIRNGLAMPPKMSVKNILQVLGKPHWALQTLKHGQPSFETLKPYMPKGLDLKQLGKFMDQTFSGRLKEEKIKPIRDMWKGDLVLKGVASEYDAQQVIRLGLDDIIVSNHGGRQLDAGESTIKPLETIAAKYGDQIEVMMDSGIRSGPDVARAMAAGAKFTFMRRSFMYGVSALGTNEGNPTISLLKTELQQVME
jgi:L-lactate dehydrogenase (cytochrome)